MRILKVKGCCSCVFFCHPHCNVTEKAAMRVCKKREPAPKFPPDDCPFWQYDLFVKMDEVIVRSKKAK